MPRIKEIMRNRWVMLGAVFALVLYYFLVVRPLSERADTLDKPLDRVWNDLVNFSVEHNGIYDLDLQKIKRTQANLRASLATTATAAARIAASTELDPVVRARLQQPFLLIEFQNERQKRTEELVALAQKNKVTLGGSPIFWFPEYRADMADPRKLWAQLSVVHQILTAAIESRVLGIKKVALLPMVSHSANGQIHWEQFPVQIELEGPMTAAENFLFSLAMGKEGERTEPGVRQPVLFLDRLILRKQSPEKLDEIQLEAVICGFVPAREFPATQLAERAGGK